MASRNSADAQPSSGHSHSEDPSDSDLDALSAQELRALLARERTHSPSLRDAVKRTRLSKQPASLVHSLEADLRRDLESLDAGIHWRDSARAVRVFEDWLDSVRRHVLPTNPADAARLAEKFIESDRQLFEAIDDSGGEVGDLMREAASLYLDALQAAGDDSATCLATLCALYQADEYGAREYLIANAARVVDPEHLRAHARGLLAKAGAEPHTHSDDRGVHRIPHEAIEASLIAEALLDPQLKVDATRIHSPEPNELQRAAFVRNFLRFDQPAGALAWLDQPWERETERLELLAQAHAAMGDIAQATTFREARYRMRPDADSLSAWLEMLAESEKPSAYQAAQADAQLAQDPLAAAGLLAVIDDWKGIEAVFVASPGTIDGDAYYSLLPLAEGLERTGHALGATLVYRALLESILGRARAKTYHHGADYWHRLAQIAQQPIDYGAIETPGDFAQRIRERHKRKPAFWAAVGRSR